MTFLEKKPTNYTILDPKTIFISIILSGQYVCMGARAHTEKDFSLIYLPNSVSNTTQKHNQEASNLNLTKFD